MGTSWAHLIRAHPIGFTQSCSSRHLGCKGGSKEPALGRWHAAWMSRRAGGGAIIGQQAVWPAGTSSAAQLRRGSLLATTCVPFHRGCAIPNHATHTLLYFECSPALEAAASTSREHAVHIPGRAGQMARIGQVALARQHWPCGTCHGRVATATQQQSILPQDSAGGWPPLLGSECWPPSRGVSFGWTATAAQQSIPALESTGVAGECRSLVHSIGGAIQ